MKEGRIIIIIFYLIIGMTSMPFALMDITKMKEISNKLRKMSNEDKPPECSTTPREDGLCYDEKNNKMFWCPEGLFCAEDGYCRYPKYLGDQCESGNDCRFGFCTMDSTKGYKTCQSLNEGEKCQFNRQCYPNNACYGAIPLLPLVRGTCLSYVTELNGNCSERPCSPQFVCVNNKCVLRGTEKEGTKVDNQFQCKSFIKSSSSGVCTNDYKEWNDDTGKMVYEASKRYPKMSWGKGSYESLTAMDSRNLGFKDLFFEMVDLFIDKGIHAKKISKCVYPIATDICLAEFGPLCYFDVDQTTFKEIFYESRHPGLSGWAIAGIIILILAIIIIGILIIYWYTSKKSKAKKEELQTSELNINSA